MFGDNKYRQQLKSKLEDLKIEVAVLRSDKDNDRRTAETKFNNMVLEKDAEIKLTAQKATDKMTELLKEVEKKLAVTEKENEMLRAINELDGDVLDVKDLVTKLIDKLPEINVNSLVVGTQETNKTK